MLLPGRARPRPAVGFNTNLDNFGRSWNSTGAAYYNTILRDDLYAGRSPFLTHIREAVLGNGIAPSAPGLLTAFGPIFRSTPGS
ncbi:MAG: hypothetical protein IPK78_07305 [Rhodospirillales bacterium]|nr:hypothetical protein [Rhodospirillales bacterium]